MAAYLLLYIDTIQESSGGLATHVVTGCHAMADLIMFQVCAETDPKMLRWSKHE